MALLDPIDRVVGEVAPKQVVDLTEKLRELGKTFEEVHKQSRVIEFSYRGGKELKDYVNSMGQVAEIERKLYTSTNELTLAVSEYTKTVNANATAQAKISILETEEAKNLAASRVELREKNRELMNEAQALDETYQARLRAAEAQKTQMAQDRIEAQKLKESQINAQDNLKDLQALVRERERMANKAANSATNFADRDMFLAEAQAARTATQALKDMELQMLQNHKETARQAAEAEKMSSAYNRLNGEHSKLYKQARDIGAAFGIESEQFKIAAKNANDLDARLKGIDEALGNHKRSVGQYGKAWDGLGHSMQQILREGPALAVSMNTFLLGISNNILPFLDELKAVRAAQVQAKAAAEEAALAAGALAVKEAEAAGMTNAEAKAQGKLAAARSLASAEGLTAATVAQRLKASFLSINTLLSVGVTLLTLFGGKIIDYITNAGGAEKATKSYNKALEDSAANTGEEIAKLVVMQATLKDTNSRRDDVLTTMEAIKESYPGYFTFLTEETRLSKELNDAIAYQIDLLGRKAEQQAGIQAINAASKDLVLTNQELNKEMGFFTKFWAARPWGVKPFDELSTSAKALIIEQEKLLKQGLISKDQYNVMYRRITEVSDAQNDLTEATKLALDPEQKKIEKVKEEIVEHQRMVEYYKATIEKWGPQMSGAAQRELDDHEAIIVKLRERQGEYEKARKEREKLDKPKAPDKTFIEIALQESETRAKLAKDGSKEELTEQRKSAGLRFAIAVGELKKEYAKKYQLRGEDLENNKQYQRDYASARAAAYDEIEKLDAKNAKKNKPKKVRVPDNTNRDLSIDTSSAELDMQLYVQRQNEFAAANKAVADDTRLSLKERLDAHEEYVLNMLNISRAESGQEVLNAQLSLDKIAEIEKKGADKRTEQEKNLLAKKENFSKQILLAGEKQASKEREIRTQSGKDAISIEEDNSREQIRQLDEGLKAIETRYKKQTNAELRVLNEKHSQKLIGDKDYYRQTQSIQAKASQDMYDEQVDWMDKQYQALINSDLPEAVRQWLEDMYGKFKAPRKQAANDRTLLDFLGFGKKDIEQQKAELAKSIEGLYSTLIEYSNNIRDSKYKKEFELLDQEKELIERNAAAEKARIDGSLLSEDEKSRALAKIDADRLASEKVNDDKRKAMQRQQAEREKRDAIFQANLNAGIAISKVFAGMGTGAQALPLALASAAIIAAQTAANIAMIASRPVPEYWSGTDNHPGGPAIVGERGTELVQLRSGERFLTPDKPTLMDLPAGAKVTPHHDLMMREAHKNEMERLQHLGAFESASAPEYPFGKLEEVITEMGKHLGKSIKEIPINNFSIDGDKMRKTTKTANGVIKFLDSHKSWKSKR